MTSSDRFAHTPEKRVGKGSPPPRPASGNEQDKSSQAPAFQQETDKGYGAGRFSQRSPKTENGHLSHGERNTHHSEAQHGHGRDYNKGSDEQRFVSKPTNKSDH